MKIHIIIQHITMALIVLSWSVLIALATLQCISATVHYEIKNDISMADIFSELLGDQMGFWDDEPNDWIYKITSIEYYEKVDLKLFQEMLEN